MSSELSPSRKEVSIDRPIVSDFRCNCTVYCIVLFSHESLVSDECPGRTESLSQSTRATLCVVVEGKMRIITHVGDDVSYAIAGVRDALEEAMSNGLGQNDPRLPNVAYLKYLADTKEGAIVDSDGDGVEDRFDEDNASETTDTDGDGVRDEFDAFPYDPNETTDTDGDGVGDESDAFPYDPNETTDTDGDGVGDQSDAFPYDPNETTDTDGDGVGDQSDAFPYDPNETADTDGDGVGDESDAFPYDPTETTDTDGDGVGDKSDAFPYDPTETADTDGDGVGDQSDAFPYDPNETTDTDGDGVGDESDAFPYDPTETTDTDGDGVGDESDAFPYDPTETTDTDGDGVRDESDAFPNDPTETTDTDGDGVGDQSDVFPYDPNETTDTDGDGVGDESDAFPNDPTETTDTDGDGVGDESDAFPYDPNETTDTDGDGVGDNAQNRTAPDDGNINAIPSQSDQGGDDDDKKLGLILAFGIPFIVGIILLACFAKNRRQAITAAEYNERNADIGDESFYSNNNLGTIPEDDVYDDGSSAILQEAGLPRRFGGVYDDDSIESMPPEKANHYKFDRGSQNNSLLQEGGIGGKFDGMDVHECSSATCKICNPGPKAIKSTTFIPTIDEDIFQAGNYEEQAEV